MKISSLTGCLVIAVVSLSACAPATLAHAEGGGAALKDTVPTLTVRGRAELQKPADQLEMTIGVVTDHADAERAIRDNSRAMQRVIDAVIDVGLDDNEYETGRFQLQPRYSSRPTRSEPDWRPEIIGYRVLNTILVKTSKMDLAGELIQSANKAGANTVDNVRFTLSSPRTHRAEAIAEATRYARMDAEAFAEAAGVRISRIIMLSLDDDQPFRPMMYERGMAMQADDAVAPPIKPGDVSVTAAVNIVFEIAQR